MPSCTASAAAGVAVHPSPSKSWAAEPRQHTITRDRKQFGFRFLFRLYLGNPIADSGHLPARPHRSYAPVRPLPAMMKRRAFSVSNATTTTRRQGARTAAIIAIAASPWPESLSKIYMASSVPLVNVQPSQPSARAGREYLPLGPDQFT